MNTTNTVSYTHLDVYKRQEMRNDREVACDTSVLKMLEEDDYADYGNTLINFAEKRIEPIYYSCLLYTSVIVKTAATPAINFNE